jgi:hypothetical protein
MYPPVPLPAVAQATELPSIPPPREKGGKNEFDFFLHVFVSVVDWLKNVPAPTMRAGSVSRRFVNSRAC